jgi:hypothetical protein
MNDSNSIQEGGCVKLGPVAGLGAEHAGATLALFSPLAVLGISVLFSRSVERRPDIGVLDLRAGLVASVFALLFCATAFLRMREVEGRRLVTVGALGNALLSLGAIAYIFAR